MKHLKKPGLLSFERNAFDLHSLGITLETNTKLKIFRLSYFIEAFV